MTTTRRKIRDLNRHRGIPNRVPPTRVQKRLTHMRTTMSWGQIAAVTGCSAAHLREILRGDRPAINRLTEEKVLTARPAPARARGMYIDATPSVRRVQALMTIGHPQHAIAAAAGTPTNRVRLLATGQTVMRQMLADKIETAWQTLRDTPGGSTRARNMAARLGWAPPIAWDDDTIDDPDAIPDWTGHCGTDRGWWAHRDHAIPTCQPCRDAHAQWLDAHRHLDRAERARALFHARADASGRGAALAEAARELLGQGYDIVQAADRLRVSRSHLEHSLARHPDQYGAAA